MAESRRRLKIWCKLQREIEAEELYRKDTDIGNSDHHVNGQDYPSGAQEVRKEKDTNTESQMESGQQRSLRKKRQDKRRTRI